MSIILHIARRDDWEAAESAGSYKADTLAMQGFIHCSKPEQLVTVANFLFRGQRDLVLLWIDTDRVAAKIRCEDLEGGRKLFPHVYGPINLDAVTKVVDFIPGEDERFTLPTVAKPVIAARPWCRVMPSPPVA